MTAAMTPYARLAGESGVVGYRIAARHISVAFADGSIYVYSWQSAGRAHVEHMKRLAVAGIGLSTYISQHVRQNYASRRRAG